MGMEKGLCILNGKPLIEYSIELLSDICNNVIISANSNDYDYLGLPVIKDKKRGIGPIGGLSAALHFSKTEDNFVLSCDMPFISIELARYILSERKEYQAVVPKNSGFYEPLCAFYRRNAVDEFDKTIKKGIYKIQRALQFLNVRFIDIDPKKDFGNELLFVNINTEENLRKFEIGNS